MHCVSRGGCYLVNSYCDLQEENQWKKESYEACWVSLVLETRPQYKLTLSETDSVRRESYKQQQPVIQEKGNNEEDKQEVTAITQDVSKPLRENFRASSLMSSPRETSSRVQRRE
ncbi:Telethonin [Dissostichus eleginoides]|uniref:Telethonin n=1 Tax=Dissostichus eleginoides TaxID=100907 RepID=A0AAD9F706_DISEL|nr:Telethonin [Dissostichus eleginoides]